MKKFLLLITITATLSSSAFAFSEKSEWYEIQKNKRVSIVQPKFAEAFGETGLFNACTSGEEIKSIHPVDVCLKYVNVTKGIPNSEIGTWIERRCVQSAVQDVIINKTITKTVCTKHAPPTEISSNECIEWGTKSITYPDNFSIEIVRADKLEAGNHLFNKTLALPTCE